MVTLNLTLLRWSTFSEKEKNSPTFSVFFWCIFIVIKWSLIIWITTITKYMSKVSWSNERLNYTRDCANVKTNFCVPGMQGALRHLPKVRQVSTRKVLCELIEAVPIHFSFLFFVNMPLSVIQSKKSLFRKSKPSKVSGKQFFKIFFLSIW